MSDVALIAVVIAVIAVSVIWVLLMVAVFAGAESVFGRPFGKWIGWFGVAIFTVVAVYVTGRLTTLACRFDPGLEQCEE